MSSLLPAKEFNRIRAAFMRRASAPHITPFALKLAYVIAFRYMGVESQIAYPAQKTLADDVNVEERTIRRLLDILQPLGLTVIPGNGRGLASTYCLDPERATRDSEKRTPESTFSDGKGGLQSPPLQQKADSRDNKRRTPDAKKGGLQSPPNLTKKNQLKKPRGKKRASRARAKSPDSSREGLTREAGEENKNQAAVADGFARFWASYPRQANEDDARTAFGKAIAGGADIEAVVARGAAYALERAEAIRNGDDPKWTPYPATWLKKRKFREPLPDGTIIDEAGNVVAYEQPQHEHEHERSIADKLIADGDLKWE